MHKVQKIYTPEFKREAVRLAQTSGKPITEGWPANWGLATRRSTSGARNWLLMAQKPFQAVVIRRLWRKRIAVSSGNWSEPGRNVTF
jgi:hypothetical protein